MESKGNMDEEAQFRGRGNMGCSGDRRLHRCRREMLALPGIKSELSSIIGQSNLRFLICWSYQCFQYWLSLSHNSEPQRPIRFSNVMNERRSSWYPNCSMHRRLFIRKHICSSPFSARRSHLSLFKTGGLAAHSVHGHSRCTSTSARRTVGQAHIQKFDSRSCSFFECL